MRKPIGWLVVASEEQGEYLRCFVAGEEDQQEAVKLGLKQLGIRHAAWHEAIAVHAMTFRIPDMRARACNRPVGAPGHYDGECSFPEGHKGDCDA
jgi:hypothetical protein